MHVFHVSVLFTYQILDIFHPLPSFVFQLFYVIPHGQYVTYKSHFKDFYNKTRLHI